MQCHKLAGTKQNTCILLGWRSIFRRERACGLLHLLQNVDQIMFSFVCIAPIPIYKSWRDSRWGGSAKIPLHNVNLAARSALAACHIIILNKEISMNQQEVDRQRGHIIMVSKVINMCVCVCVCVWPLLGYLSQSCN